MTRRRTILRGLLLIGLVVVAGWLWFTRLHTPAFKFVEVGKPLINFYISGSTLVVVPPKPGVLFSTVKKPGNQEQFAYVILFKYGLPLRSCTSNLGPLGTFDGRKAQSMAEYKVNGKRIEASYGVELNETQTAVANESLAIGGKSVDMTSGQVFLIDLTTEAQVYQQMKVELPAIPSKLESEEDAQRAAQAIRKSLESQDPAIKAFLR